VIPVVGEKEREANVLLDDAVHTAVRRPDRASVSRRHGDRFGDLDVRQLESHEVRALRVLGGDEDCRRKSLRHESNGDDAGEGDGRQEAGFHGGIILKSQLSRLNSQGSRLKAQGSVSPET
jgi:hypothetical protein